MSGLPVDSLGYGARGGVGTLSPDAIPDVGKIRTTRFKLGQLWHRCQNFPVFELRHGFLPLRRLDKERRGPFVIPSHPFRPEPDHIG